MTLGKGGDTEEAAIARLVTASTATLPVLYNSKAIEKGEELVVFVAVQKGSKKENGAAEDVAG